MADFKRAYITGDKIKQKWSDIMIFRYIDYVDALPRVDTGQSFALGVQSQVKTEAKREIRS